MELRFNIKDIDQPEALKEYCEIRFQHLKTFSAEILEAYIDFHKHTKRRKGRLFHLDVKLKIPGKTFYAKKDAVSFNEAVDQVTEVLRKQLERHSKRGLRLKKFTRPFKSVSDRFFKG